MNYKKILEKVAAENNTDAKKIDCEIRKALALSNLDIEPALFIALASAKAKKTTHRN